MCLGSLGIKDVPVIGDKFLCIQDVRMIDDGELVYKKGEFYQSEKEGCITDLANRKDHYWEETDWTLFFIRWKGHKRKHMDNKRYTLQESWFSEDDNVRKDVWNTALEFEKEWLKNRYIDPEWWNLTPYGSIILDLEIEDGIVSIEFGDHRIGFFTDFREGMTNYASEGFDWTPNCDLLSENLKILLKRK
jgi:hypothetical protein